jgi:DNA-binding NarL/FixJ family response regulator
VVLRIVIVEDDFLVRQGIERALAGQSDLELVASCDTYDAAIDAIDVHRPDVVVTDIRMPPTMSDEGIQLAAQVTERELATGVVVLSQYDEPDYVLALLDGGTDGRAYLLKERISDVVQLTGAVRTVARGGSVVDPRVIERLVEAKSGTASAFARLTVREREVLEAMASGMSNSGIADDLDIGLRSVEKHVSSIFAKLGLEEEVSVNRRVQAVLLLLSELQ